MMPQEKKTERERRKYLDLKKYEVFKKKEVARVKGHSLKKMSERLQVTSAASTSETTPTTSSAFLTKQILNRSVRKTERSLQSSPREEGRGNWNSCQKIQSTHSCT